MNDDENATVLPPMLASVRLERPQSFSMSYIAYSSENKTIAYTVSLTPYAYTNTIGVHVRLSRQGSDSRTVNNYLNHNPFYTEIVDWYRQHVLLSIANRFGGALHMTRDTIVVTGSSVEILRLFGPIVD